MRSAASILLLTSLLYASTPSFADNLSQDCGIFAINQFGFNNAQGFTLAAFEGSPADDTVTAIPLEIQPRFQLLSAIEHEGVGPTVFNLTNGTLYAEDTPAIAEITSQVQNGTLIQLFRSAEFTSISQFCAIADTDPAGGSPDPTLAVFGNPDSFSICKTNTIPPTSAVVYNATANATDYDLDNCVQVQIRVIIT